MLSFPDSKKSIETGRFYAPVFVRLSFLLSFEIGITLKNSILRVENERKIKYKYYPHHKMDITLSLASENMYR